MIGDWVRGTATLDQEWYGWQIAPGECIQVRSILHTGINYESNGVSPSFEDDTIRFDDIEPIPITKKILNKNGWRKKHDVYVVLALDEAQYLEWYEYEGRLRRYYKHKDGREEMVFSVLGLSYVHQIQHALRLCGIDKEIEL